MWPAKNIMQSTRPAKLFRFPSPDLNQQKFQPKLLNVKKLKSIDLNQWFSYFFKILFLRPPQRFFSIAHEPLFLSINSGSAAKRSSTVADVKDIRATIFSLCRRRTGSMEVMTCTNAQFFMRNQVKSEEQKKYHHVRQCLNFHAKLSKKQKNVFTSVNICKCPIFHAKLSEEQKKDLHARKCLIFHTK